MTKLKEYQTQTSNKLNCVGMEHRQGAVDQKCLKQGNYYDYYHHHHLIIIITTTIII